jgi:sec-independent protein translocase protein TatC
MKSFFAGKSSDKTFLEHLEDLRKVLIRVLLCFVLLFPVTMYFASGMIKFLVMTSCPPEFALSFFSPLEPVWVEIKTALGMALFIGFPYVAFEFWRFIAPGLYERERNFLFRLVFISWVLFVVGILFCFYLVLPAIMQFSMSMGSDYLRPVIGLQNFISMVAMMLLGFGVMFQFPVAIFLLVKTGLVKLETFKKQRFAMIIIILLLAAVITPTPDMLNQLILAVPTYMLFELGLLITGLAVKKNPDDEGSEIDYEGSFEEKQEKVNQPEAPEYRKNLPGDIRRRRKIRAQSRR